MTVNKSGRPGGGGGGTALPFSHVSCEGKKQTKNPSEKKKNTQMRPAISLKMISGGKYST